MFWDAFFKNLNRKGKVWEKLEEAKRDSLASRQLWILISSKYFFDLIDYINEEMEEKGYVWIPKRLVWRHLGKGSLYRRFLLLMRRIFYVELDRSYIYIR